MIVIRIDFKNGLHLEYNFPEIATAKVIYDRLSTARVNEEMVEIDDYAGRSAWIDGAMVMVIGLIDIEVEARSVIEVNVLVEAAGRSALPKPRPVEAPAPRLDA